jgi:hypothetical protein
MINNMDDAVAKKIKSAWFKYSLQGFYDLV